MLDLEDHNVSDPTVKQIINFANNLLVTVLTKLGISNVRVVKQMIKYGTVGVSNTLIDLGVLNLLVWLGMSAIPANSISFSLAALNSFYWNKFWTFNDREGSWKKQIIPFILVAIFCLGLSDVLIYYFHEQLGYNLNLVKIASFVVVFWFNFFIPKLYIFKS